MSASTTPMSEAAQAILRDLSKQTGQPPTEILDAALGDYRRKVVGESGTTRGSAPLAAEEPEILADPGRIRVPARTRRTLAVRVALVGRRPPRVSEVDDD